MPETGTPTEIPDRSVRVQGPGTRKLVSRVLNLLTWNITDGASRRAAPSTACTLEERRPERNEWKVGSKQLATGGRQRL
jgi:hypothetical protein